MDVDLLHKVYRIIRLVAVESRLAAAAAA